jgi:transposase-like protein
MNTNKQGKPPKYDNSFKVAVATEYLTGNLGYGALAKKYDLPLVTVRFFVKWYRKNQFASSTLAASPEQQPTADTVSAQQIAKDLKDANLKIVALEMLIQNASKEVGFDIIKKLGAKQ